MTNRKDTERIRSLYNKSLIQQISETFNRTSQMKGFLSCPHSEKFRPKPKSVEESIGNFERAQTAKNLKQTLGSPFKNGVSPYRNVKSRVMTSVPKRKKLRSVTAPPVRSSAHIHKVKQRKRLLKTSTLKNKSTAAASEEVVISSRTGRKIRILSSTREDAFPSNETRDRTLERVRDILKRSDKSRLKKNKTSSWQAETQWALNSLRQTKNRPVSSSFIDHPRTSKLIRRTLNIGREKRPIRVILRLQIDEFDNRSVNIEAYDDSINCLYTLKMLPPSNDDHDDERKNNNNNDKSIELLERVANSLSICNISDKSPGHLISDLAESSSTKILNPHASVWNSTKLRSIKDEAEKGDEEEEKESVLSRQVKRKLSPVFSTTSGGDRTPPVLLAAFSVIQGELEFHNIKIDGMEKVIHRLENMCENIGSEDSAIFDIQDFLKSIPDSVIQFLRSEGVVCM
jgi:hypothetical protein